MKAAQEYHKILYEFAIEIKNQPGNQIECTPSTIQTSHLRIVPQNLINLKDGSQEMKY